MLFGVQPPRQSAKFKPKASCVRYKSFQYNIYIGNSLTFSSNTSRHSLWAIFTDFYRVLCSLSTQRGHFCEVVFLARWVWVFWTHFNVLQSLEMSEVGSCQQVLLLLLSLLLSWSALRIKVESVCNANAFDFRLMTADRLKHNHYKTYAKWRLEVN